MHLNIIQLAESLGVDESAVAGWVRHDGLPAIEDRGRLLFDRAQVVAWAAARGLGAKAGFLAATAAPVGPAQLAGMIRTGGCWRDVPGHGVLAVLEQVVARLPGATPPVRTMLAQRVRSPGGVTWAPVGGGFALPHLRAPVTLGRDAGLVACVMLRDALPLPEPPPDGAPVTRLLFFIAPSPRAHLEILAQLSAALTRGPLRSLLLAGAEDAAILSALEPAGVTAEGGR